jgi:LytS/YehU family sensor histidine kinase
LDKNSYINEEEAIELTYYIRLYIRKNYEQRGEEDNEIKGTLNKLNNMVNLITSKRSKSDIQVEDICGF